MKLPDDTQEQAALSLAAMFGMAAQSFLEKNFSKEDAFRIFTRSIEVAWEAAAATNKEFGLDGGDAAATKQ